MLKLPRLQQNYAIVNERGEPTTFFVRLLNSEAFEALEKAVVSLEEVVVAQAATILSLSEVVAALQASSQVAQQAQQTANDTLSGNTGSNTGVVTADGSWQEAAAVSLTGVSAGTLTIFGTGPIQSPEVRKLSPGVANGDFRVVEVFGGVDEVLLTGTYSAASSGEPDVPPLVSNPSSQAVAALSSARTSTGTVGYRVDVRQNSGTLITDLSVYLFARRS